MGWVLASPFIYLKSTKFLTVASLISILSILVFVYTVIYDASQSLSTEKMKAIHLFPNPTEINLTEMILAFPAIFIAFNC